MAHVFVAMFMAHVFVAIFMAHVFVAVFMAHVFVAIFMAHENGGNKGKLRDDRCKVCWMKQTLQDFITSGVQMLFFARNCYSSHELTSMRRNAYLVTQRCSILQLPVSYQLPLSFQIIRLIRYSLAGFNRLQLPWLYLWVYYDKSVIQGYFNICKINRLFTINVRHLRMDLLVNSNQITQSIINFSISLDETFSV